MGHPTYTLLAKIIKISFRLNASNNSGSNPGILPNIVHKVKTPGTVTGPWGRKYCSWRKKKYIYKNKIKIICHCKSHASSWGWCSLKKYIYFLFSTNDVMSLPTPTKPNGPQNQNEDGFPWLCYKYMVRKREWEEWRVGWNDKVFFLISLIINKREAMT